MKSGFWESACPLPAETPAAQAIKVPETLPPAMAPAEARKQMHRDNRAQFKDALGNLFSCIGDACVRQPVSSSGVTAGEARKQMHRDNRDQIKQGFGGLFKCIGDICSRKPNAPTQNTPVQTTPATLQPHVDDLD